MRTKNTLWLFAVAPAFAIAAIAIWLLGHETSSPLDLPDDAREQKRSEPDLFRSRLAVAPTGPFRAAFRVESDSTVTMDAERLVQAFADAAKGDASSPGASTVSGLRTHLRGLVAWVAGPGSIQLDTVRLWWTDRGSSVDAVNPPGNGTGTANEYGAALETGAVLVEFDQNRRPHAIRVSEDMRPEAMMMWAALLDELMPSIRIGQATWSATGRDATGEYVAQYTAKPANESSLHVTKVKREYTAVDTYESATLPSPSAEVPRPSPKELVPHSSSQITWNAADRVVDRVTSTSTLEADTPLFELSMQSRLRIERIPWAELAAASGHARDGAQPTTAANLSGQTLRQQLRDIAARHAFDRQRPVESGVAAADLERRATALISEIVAREEMDIAAGYIMDRTERLGALFEQHPPLVDLAAERLTDESLKGPRASVLITAIGWHGGDRGEAWSAAELEQPERADFKLPIVASLASSPSLGQRGRQLLHDALAGSVQLPSEVAAHVPLLVSVRAERLRETEPEEAEEWRTAIVEQLQKPRQPGQARRVEQLLAAAGNIGDPRMLSVAEPYFADPVSSVRSAAAESLRRIDSPLASRRILRSLAAEPEAQARYDIVRLLGEVDAYAGFYQQAGDLLAREPVDEVRRVGLLALANHGLPASGAIRRFVDDPDEDVRELARRLLVQSTASLTAAEDEAEGRSVQ